MQPKQDSENLAWVPDPHVQETNHTAMVILSLAGSHASLDS